MPPIKQVELGGRSRGETRLGRLGFSKGEMDFPILAHASEWSTRTNAVRLDEAVSDWDAGDPRFPVHDDAALIEAIAEAEFFCEQGSSNSMRREADFLYQMLATEQELRLTIDVGRPATDSEYLTAWEAVR